MIRCQDCREVVEVFETERRGQLDLVETPEGPTLLRGPEAPEKIVVCCGPAGHRLEDPARPSSDSWVPPWERGS